MRKVWTSQGKIPANGWAYKALLTGRPKMTESATETIPFAVEKFEFDSIGLRETGDVVNPI